MDARPIRLLLFVRHPVGGIRTYLKYVYHYLSPDRYDITLLTIHEPEARLIPKDLANHRIRLIEIEGRRFLNLVRAARSLLKSESFDLIHSHGFTAGLIAVLGNVFVNTTHLITSHDVMREEQFQSLKGHIKLRLMEWMLLRADHIQSVSEDAQDNLLTFLPALNRSGFCSVIPNGVRLDAAQPPASGDDLRLRAACEEETVLFGFLGRLMPQKGFRELVEAVRTLAPQYDSGKFRIVIVNDGAYIREYRADIEMKKLQAYFSFVGFVPDVNHMMKQLDCVVVPSIWEAGPMVPMEAMLAGCPVIASDCIGLREAVRGTPAVVVRSGDVLSLSEGMKHCMENLQHHKYQARQFVAAARERFDSRKTAAQLESLIERILASKRK